MDSEDFVILGTLIEGPEIDLIELSGLELTEEEQQRIWDEITPRRILVEDLLCEEIEIEEFDDAPGLSDSSYEYLCGPREQFIERLRKVLLRYTGKQAKLSISIPAPPSSN